MTRISYSTIDCFTREHLAALLAEKVLGWSWWASPEGRLWLGPPDFDEKPKRLSWGWQHQTARPDEWPQEDWNTALPDFSAWAELEPVITRLELAGFLWSIEAQPGDEYAAAFWARRQPKPEAICQHRYHSDKGIALSVAALAAAQVNVRLLFGDG